MTQVITNKEQVINLVENGNKFGIVTHAGLHHADEVFAVAMLQHSSLADHIAWIKELDQRTYSTTEAVAAACTEGDAVLVIDMAQSAWDHHGPAQAKAMDGERKLSACGLVWRDFKKEVLDTAEHQVPRTIERLNLALNGLVAGIDAHDTGDAPLGLGFGYIYNTLAKRNHWNFQLSLDWAMVVLDSLLSSLTGEMNPLGDIWGPETIAPGADTYFPRMASAIWGCAGFRALKTLSPELQKDIFDTCIAYEQAEKKAHETIAKELLALPRHTAIGTSGNEVCYVVVDRFIMMDVKEYDDVLAEGIQLVVNKEVDPKTKELTGLWQYRALANCGARIMKTGVTAGQIEGVTFIHPTGYTGKFSTLEDLAKCIKD